MLTQQQVFTLSGLFDIKNMFQKEIFISCALSLTELTALIKASLDTEGAQISKLAEFYDEDLKSAKQTASKLERYGLAYITRNHKGDRRAYSMLLTQLGFDSVDITTESIRLKLDVIFSEDTADAVGMLSSLIFPLNLSQECDPLLNLLLSVHKANCQIRETIALAQLTHFSGMVLVGIASIADDMLFSKIPYYFGASRSSAVPSLQFLENNQLIHTFDDECSGRDIRIALSEKGLQTARDLINELHSLSIFYEGELDSYISDFGELIRLQRLRV